jgi:hypothetical protein
VLFKHILLLYFFLGSNRLVEVVTVGTSIHGAVSCEGVGVAAFCADINAFVFVAGLVGVAEGVVKSECADEDEGKA